jgi:hypothetical protein
MFNKERAVDQMSLDTRYGNVSRDMVAEERAGCAS